MSGIVGSVARTGGAGLAGVVGAQAVGGAVVGAAGGALFGLSYGTAIRIGYEQIYPALFPDGKPTHDLIHVLQQLETMYDFIGGKAAHIFGVEQGVKAHASVDETQNFTYGNINPKPSEDFLTTLDKFFQAITPLPQAYGHSETDTNINQNLGDTFNQDKAFNDAIASSEGDKILLNDFQNKIRNYNRGELQYLLDNTTDHGKRSIIIMFMNKIPVLNIPSPPPTTEQLRKQQITESGLSPLAYQARETFKANIDQEAARLKQLSSMTLSSQGNDIAAFERIKEAVVISVAKLSSLRIKYKQVYGVYY